MLDVVGGRSRFAAGAVVAAGVLLGLACVSVFAAVPTGLRYLELAVVIVIGLVVFGSERIADVAGAHVARGVGASVVLLGAYLLGPLLVASTTPRRFSSAAPPSPTAVVVMTFLPVLVFLLGFAARGTRAAGVGVGIVVPTAVVAVLAVSGVDQPALVLTTLGMALVALVVVVRVAPDSSWSTVGITAGGIAATATVGTGLMPLGFVSGSSGLARVLPVGVQATAIVAGLAVATVFGVIAVLRRDAAGGLVVGGAVAAPPLVLYSQPVSDGIDVVLASVPVVVVVVAVAGILLPPVLRAASRAAGWLRPGGGTTRGALAAVAGTAAVAFTTQALPLVAWPYWARGSFTLVVYACVVVLAMRLPGVPGAVLAGVVLVGLSLTEPASQIFLMNPLSGTSSMGMAACVGLGVAVAAVWVLVRAHRRPGVVAAAAYLLVGQVAFTIWWTQLPSGYGMDLHAGDAAPALVVWLPLVVAGVVGLVLVLRGALAHGQAVLAVVLGAAGFTLLSVLGGTYGRSESRETLRGLAPLTPTDTWGAAGTIDESSPWVLWSAFALLALALSAALTTVPRPSAAVTAGVALTGVAATQVALGSAIEIGGPSLLDTVVWGSVLVAVAAWALALIAIRTAPDRLDTPVTVPALPNGSHTPTVTDRPVGDEPTPAPDLANAPRPPEDPQHT
ncbi:hypothetical protein [Actinokineospora globicatena]|uniref:hypothetical protein n=1 Tax=Actinokineospora globicatena TaxID=103729 RepID=UPI0020A2739C|nr:hypothetical protein [Actinokineospora globicatena]MCP2305582.1 hypothetical protein [Actinokineospora globicatena]GLW81452.1 hypothetical protein Aglo01_59330 [Actinokineospora globicatena]GLW87850.1 hypothetical protein Aglo02_54890 [Actinokineospora globicatena]